MKNFVILALFASVPLAAGAGYALNSDPQIPPSLTIRQTLEAKLKSDGPGEEVWGYVVTKGILEGSALPIEGVWGQSEDSLRASGVEGGYYAKRTCRVFSTSGQPERVDDPVYVVHCTMTRQSNDKVRAYVENTLAPSGLIG